MSTEENGGGLLEVSGWNDRAAGKIRLRIACSWSPARFPGGYLRITDDFFLWIVYSL